MAWKRWRWETQQRKDSDLQELNQDFILEIDPNMLTNVSNKGITYLGRGSFGVV